MTSAVLSPDTRAVGRGRPGVRSNLTSGAGLGLGIAMLWFSLLVLIPLAAIVATAGGPGG
jgi:sulfate transport system permease protein